MAKKEIKRFAKKSIALLVVTICALVAFVFASTGLDAAFAWDPPGRWGTVGYNGTQSEMVTYSSLGTQTESGNSYGVTSSVSLSANMWHCENHNDNYGIFVMTAKLSDNLYRALLRGQLQLYSATTANLVNENLLLDSTRRIKAFISIGNISGNGLGKDNFTETANATGNEQSKTGLDDGTVTTEVTYSSTPSSGQYVRYGITAYQKSSRAGAFGGYTYSKGQINDITMRLTLSAKETAGPNITVSTSGGYATSATVTIEDTGSGLWKYSVNGSQTEFTGTSSVTTITTVTLSGFGQHTIEAYDNLGNRSTATIKYYSPQIVVEAYTNDTKSSTGGTVGNTEAAGQSSYTYNNAVVTGTYNLYAKPNDGYYLKGWAKGSGSVEAGKLLKSYTLPAEDAYTSPLYFRAYFVPISTTNKTVEYNGNQQGVDAPTNLPSGFSASYSYTGIDGTTYDSSNAPINAGTYNCRVSILYSGSEVGYKNVTLTIAKVSNITVTLNALNPISYGQILNRVALSGTVKYAGNSKTVQGTFSWVNPNTMPEISSTKQYEYKFTPTGSDKDNFETQYVRSVAITVNNNMSVGAIDSYTALGGPGLTNANNKAVFNSNTKPISGDKAQVSVTATTYTEGNYVFLGWLKNGVYASKDLTYTYTIPNETSGELNATLVAVFTKIGVEGLEFVSYGNYKLNKRYTGSAEPINFSFSLPGEIYHFETTPLVYTQGGGFPVAIGSETATFTIYNRQLGVTVFSGTIQINIIENIVSVEIDQSNSVGYNAQSGWGQTIYYILSVPGALRGTVTKYQYRLEGESVWHDVMNVYNPVSPTTDPQNQTGCPVRFEASAGIGDSQSVVRKYYFKAVNNTHGTNPAYYGGNKSVATSESYTATKIDRYTPSISVVARIGGSDYNSAWTNQNVTFVFTASFGGSGAIIKFSNDNSYFTDTEATSGFNTGETNIITQNATFIWTVSKECKEIPYYFAISSGTNITVNVENPITLRIDKTKPTISDAVLQRSPNSNGWVGETSPATFTASEQSGWAGVASITVSPAITLKVNGVISGTPQDYNNNCELTISDYREYTVTVTDKAGNVATEVFRFKVDTKIPELMVEAGSYIPGIWQNTAAKVNLLAQTGASGVKFYYIRGALEILIGSNEFLYDIDKTNPFQDVRNIFIFDEEINEQIQFKAVTGAGHSAILNFGYIRLDYTAPTLTYKTNMEYYQSNWRSDPLTAEFYAKDTASGVVTTAAVDDAETVVVYQGLASAEEHLFDFVIKKSVIYTVTVWDNAGNSSTLEFYAKVDIVEPDMDYAAYVGNTDEAYNFDKWINRTQYGDNAFVRFVFDLTVSASGGKIQYKDGSGQWRDLTSLMREEGNENGLIQNVHAVVNVTNDQNGPYYIRLATGSGKYTDEINLGTIMIDSTLPYFSYEPVFSDAQNINEIMTGFDTAWTYKVIRTRFIPYDATSGVKSVTVYRYAPSDTGYTNPSAVECVKEATTEYYFFLMDRYASYEIVIEDNSGNVHRHPVIRAMVDTTDGFSLNVSATKDGQPFVSGDWLQQALDAVNFDFEIVFDPAGGYTGFGPSGGRIEFSVDGGETWVTSLELPDGVQYLIVNPGDPLKASMTAVYEQHKSYKFRVITGSGRIYEAPGEYLIRKDSIDPELSYEATVQGAPYDSGWTAKDVIFTLTYTVGPSNGQIKMLTSSSPVADLAADGLNWITIGEVTQSYGGTFYYTLNRTIDNVYYYFRLDAGTGKRYINPNGKLVKIDKDVFGPTFSLYKGEELFTGGWSDTTLTAELNSLPYIISGFEVYYAKGEPGSTLYDYYRVDRDIDGAYRVRLNSSERKDIRFKVVNGAGVEFFTPVTTYGIDLVMPIFDITFNGETPREYDPANPNAAWYLGDIQAAFRLLNIAQVISGVTLQYAIRQNGAWGEWTSEGIDADTLILKDNSSGGGTVYDIRFRVISGAGKYEEKEYTARIDDNFYQVNVTQFVGSTEGLSYAEYVEGLTDRQRGGSLTITFKEAEGYRLKSVFVRYAYYAKTGTDDGSSPAYNLSGMYWFDYYELSLGGNAETIDITVGGSDVEVYLYFIKDITLKYSNLVQYRQGNVITGIGIEVDEYGFYQTYANENLEFNISYNGSASVPNAIGVYDVRVSTENIDFNIVNPDFYIADGETVPLQLVVRYFAGDGDSYNPYMIYNYEDLTYLNIYMNSSSEYDYLGFRLAAAYALANDIELPSDFAPLCADEDNGFNGDIYGRNHKIYYNGSYKVSGDFGLFLNVIDGTFFNLGIEYDLDVSGAVEADIGLLAANALIMMIGDCYVYSNISVKDSVGVNVGGMAGEVFLCAVDAVFADVHIDIRDSLGHFGGIVGAIYADAETLGFIAGSFSVSQITVDNTRIGNREFGEVFSAGSYIGWLQTAFSDEIMAGQERPENAYLKRSLFIKDSDGFVRAISLGIGNEGEFGYRYSLPFAYAEFLACDVYLGDEALPEDSRWFIGYLARLRVADAGFAGEGTEESPFVIINENNLKYVEAFPWAYFRQGASFAVKDSFEALATKSAFMGVYDGNGYELRIGEVAFDGSFGGLFGIVLGGSIRELKIVGIEINHTASSDTYIGGLVGIAMALEDGEEVSTVKIENIIVSGSIKLNAAGHNAFVGGISALLYSATIKDCISIMNITVNGASEAYVGGVLAWAGDTTSIVNIVSLSKINVNFSKNGVVGSAIGLIQGTGVNGQKVYNVEGSTYVNGRLYDAPIGQNQQQISEIYKRSYNDTVSAAGGIVFGQKSILDVISGLYPFAGGTGTSTDPFLIANYKQLLLIGNYMYAHFRLINHIVIGDIDGDSNGNGIPDGQEPGGVPTPDGVVDEFDNYNYDFKPIGAGAVFTGNLSGSEYSISGLTAPLFEANNGTISNLILNLNYRQYASEDDVPMGARGAIVDGSGKDVVYGGVARFNYPNGKISSVTVGGRIVIQTAGKAKVKAGGIVGVTYGGSIMGCLNAVEMEIDSLVIDAGGIVGSLEGNSNVSGNVAGEIRFTHNYSLASIRANGGTVKAGLLVGAQRYAIQLNVGTADTRARTYINGVDKGSDWLIGYKIN
jgi:hypothetical protein